MRINYALLSKRENLPADRVLLVDAILGQNPDLDRAYRMRDSLCAAYSFGTKEEMHTHLLRWARIAEHSGLRPFNILANTVRENADYISNNKDTGLSNGSVEGTNNLLNKVKARCYGFKSIKGFIDMIYVVASDRRIDFYGKPRMR